MCSALRPGSFSLRAVLVFLAMTMAGSASNGQDPPGATPDESPAKRRLEVMRKALDDLRVTSTAISSPAALKFGQHPLLRYSDQTRGLLDAAVWRLGERGRPTALVTLELYQPREGAEALSYEFLSLSTAPLEMQSARGIKWAPASSELKMLPLEGAPLRAESPRARLTQLRQLAQRFSAREELQNDQIECRLLPQPIDRYNDAKNGILDGAVFAFANGTNPEVGLILECSEKEWSYGAFRLSAAALAAELDDKTVFTAEKVNSLNGPVSSPYLAKRHPIDLPE